MVTYISLCYISHFINAADREAQRDNRKRSRTRQRQTAMEPNPAAEGLRSRQKAAKKEEEASPAEKVHKAHTPVHAQVAAAQVGDILSVLLFFRFINALCVRTFFQPDEYFQALEPAWSIAFGNDSGAWLTWVSILT